MISGDERPVACPTCGSGPVNLIDTTVYDLFASANGAYHGQKRPLEKGDRRAHVSCANCQSRWPSPDFTRAWRLAGSPRIEE